MIARSFAAKLLALFYNPGYAAQSGVFVILTAAAALHFGASMLTSGITSARCFRIQVPLYLLVAAATACGCLYWVPTMGLAGAALGVVCGAAVRLVAAAVVITYLLQPNRLTRVPESRS
jgi:O-antigen/teichoic acid export membrane protein